MGRIRTVKPGFWKHEELSDLAAETHMLAAALLNYADDEGYFNANPKLVKAECCPLREDSVSVQDSLNELKKIGFITTGIGSDGKTYGCVEKFTEHQRINRPTPSNIAKLRPFTESSVSTHGVLTDGKEGKGREGKGKGKEGNCTQIAFDQFVDMAQRVGLSVPQNLNARRTANLDRRLQECGGLDGWRHALDKIENSDFNNFLCFKDGCHDADEKLLPDVFHDDHNGMFSFLSQSRPRLPLPRPRIPLP